MLVFDKELEHFNRVCVWPRMDFISSWCNNTWEVLSNWLFSSHLRKIKQSNERKLKRRLCILLKIKKKTKYQWTMGVGGCVCLFVLPPCHSTPLYCVCQTAESSLLMCTLSWCRTNYSRDVDSFMCWLTIFSILPPCLINSTQYFCTVPQANKPTYEKLDK